MFKEMEESAGVTPSPNPIHALRLVAVGSLLSVDPDRVIVKKIVLTGFPYKIHKRGAVIKHMFYHPGTNPPVGRVFFVMMHHRVILPSSADDVRWFAPVELWTKYGRTGHIKEPLGPHLPTPHMGLMCSILNCV